MTNEEIVTALKNAIERNEDLNEAGETLINAGYTQQEVQEAKDSLTRGVLASQAEDAEPIEVRKSNISEKISGIFDKIFGIFKRKPREEEEPEINKVEKPAEKEIESEKPEEEIAEPRSLKLLPSVPRPMKEKSSNNTLLIATTVLLMLLILGLILMIIFKDTIVNMFG